MDLAAPALAFRAALVALFGAALLGVGLRAFPWLSAEGLDYRNILHAHSHLALLGWVGNTFLALAAALFLDASARPTLARIFIILQIALLGMVPSFALSGYSAVSIALSTIHLGGTVWLALLLWRAPRAHPIARAFLRAGIVWLFACGLGPLALGPLAALGLRGDPPYQLALYFYLHGLANGWFTFFLLAAGLQHLAPRADAAFPSEARRALAWLLAGSVLTYAQSTLWLDPPAPVRFVAALGGLTQLVGAFLLARAALRSRPFFVTTRWIRLLLVVATGAWALKLLLQLLAALPVLAPLANHPFVIIAFLHLFFLGAVTPALLAAGFAQGWCRLGLASTGGGTLFLGGILASELLLVAVALGRAPTALPLWLLLSTLPLLLGASALLSSSALRPRLVSS